MTTETTCILKGVVVDLKNKWETNDQCMDTEGKQNHQAHLKKESKQITSKDKLAADVTIDIPTCPIAVEEKDKKQMNTYRIRFKHGDSETRRENSNCHDGNVENTTDTKTVGCSEDETRKLLTRKRESMFDVQTSCTEVKNKICEKGNLQEEEIRENEAPKSPKNMDEDNLCSNLPLLPEMHGNVRIKSASTKAIRSLSTSKSSNWVLVGLNGKRHLRRPSPFPKETFPPISKIPSLTAALPSLPLSTSLPRMMNRSADRDDSVFSLPRIADDMLTKVNEWGFKTNPMTFSALLEVDHRKACLRDIQTVEFGKELGMLLKTQKQPQSENSEDSERTENDAKSVEDPTESDDPLEEHIPSTPVVILTPVPAADKDEHSSDEKVKKTRRHTTGHTTCSRECGKTTRKKDDTEHDSEFQATKKPPHETESCKPVKNTQVDQPNTPCQTIKRPKHKKKSSLRKSRSTLPETLPNTPSFEKLPKLPNNVQCVFDETKSTRPRDSKNIGNANQPKKSFTQRTGGFREKNEGEFIDESSVCDLVNVSHRDDKKTCTDLTSNERSDSIMRERLADNMDFECKNDMLCTFEDDNTLQRAVVLRNRAFYPQPNSPTQCTDQEVSCNSSYVFNKQSTEEWQSMDEVEVDEYSEPSRNSSFMEKLRPTLCDLERLLSKNLKSAPDNFNEHGEYLKDIKQTKSVRFADLPPRRKREPSRSISDPTNDTSKAIAQGSAEWNECFLVAVGENRTIKKEVGQLHRQQTYRHQYSDFNEDTEDDIGPELIEREMRRYTHWLRHDRAIEQHRWFSSNVSHRNFPMSTHQVPSQQSTTPYGISAQTSNPTISAKIAKTIGLYSVVPKPEIDVPSRPVRFPKVPVLPPIAGGSNEVLFSKTFTGEVKGLPIGGRSTKNKRCSTGNKRRRGGIE